MIELEQCPFCNGQTEIVTLSCSSGGTPCYCFRCTKCGGIRRFGTLNPADICRECELSGKTRELEEAGDRIVKLVNEVYAMMGGPVHVTGCGKRVGEGKEEAGMGIEQGAVLIIVGAILGATLVILGLIFK